MENFRENEAFAIDNRMETNRAVLQGNVLTSLEFSHKSYGEAFYLFEMGVCRKSGYIDQIKVIISERLIWNFNIDVKDRVKIEGQVRTYNEDVNGRSRLNVMVFAKTIERVDFDSEDRNEIFLEGFICKPPIQRISPLGRNICDLMLAVNRMYNKSDYIPCIVWGRNASYAGALKVGTKLEISGRMQSREYKKYDEEGNSLIKTAYEVSVLKIEE